MLSHFKIVDIEHIDKYSATIFLENDTKVEVGNAWLDEQKPKVGGYLIHYKDKDVVYSDNIPVANKPIATVKRIRSLMFYRGCVMLSQTAETKANVLDALVTSENIEQNDAVGIITHDNQEIMVTKEWVFEHDPCINGFFITYMDGTYGYSGTISL